ncbi:MAG: mmgE/PrpD family protein [Rhizobacter sp.]|nr:mmgE/PrpD family protein [Rhizobacter sp.]
MTGHSTHAHHPPGGLTECIARFIVDTPGAAIPAPAFERAGAAVVDTIGCMLAGSASELRDPVLNFLAQSGGSGKHPVAGTTVCTSAALAALANGSFCHALDFDDTLSMMPAHPSGVILPALLASLDEHTDGARLLDAYVIGLEVGAKIGLGITNGHYRRGFHATGTLAIFSAVAALARLHRLDVATTRTAIGVAASMASGLRCNFGTMVKPLHSGWAAHNAVTSVALARSGMSAHPAALEASAGFFAAYGTEQSDTAVTQAALGAPFTLVTPGVALKKYPCIYLLHRPIEAVLKLREALAFKPGDIDWIECRGAPGAFLPLITHLPATGLEGKFSLDYILAAGVVDGRHDLASFTDEAVNRAEVARLYPRLRRVEDERCLGGEMEPAKRSAGSIGFIEVTVRLLDGRQQTVRVDRPPGAPERPLSWSDLREKFLDCCRFAHLGQMRSARLFDAWRNLGATQALAPLVSTLAKDGE